MSIGFGIKVVLEIIVVMLIAYGIMNEEKLIAFEDELFPVLKFCFHKYVLKDIKRTNKTPVLQQKKVLKTKKTTLKVINGKKATGKAKRYVA